MNAVGANDATRRHDQAGASEQAETLPGRHIHREGLPELDDPGRQHRWPPGAGTSLNLLSVLNTGIARGTSGAAEVCGLDRSKGRPLSGYDADLRRRG